MKRNGSYRWQESAGYMGVNSKQNVVAIMDASKEINPCSLHWALQYLNLRSGDVVTVLRVVHQVHTHNMSRPSRIKPRYLLGCNPMLGWYSIQINEETTRRRAECERNEEMHLIRRKCEDRGINFRIVVNAGPSAKRVAVEAARDLKATWIILDRHIKKDKRYFLDNLYCGISRVKKNNIIKNLRAGNLGSATLEQSSESKESKESAGSSIFKNIYEATPVPYNEEPLEDLFSLDVTSQLVYNAGDIRPTAVKELQSSNAAWSRTDSILDNGENPSADHEDISHNIEKLNGHGYKENSLSSIGNYVDSEKYTVDSTEIKTMVENSIKQMQLEEETVDSNDECRVKLSDKNHESSPCLICKYRSSVFGQELTRYTYAQLEAATDNFSEENFLSENRSRFVYRGHLKQGLYITVKQHKPAKYIQQEHEFRSEVEALSRAQHRNLVMLLGYCSENNHRLLVYEYVCNRSLRRHLSKSNGEGLEWKYRMKIAMGAARALRYLHEECRGRCIVHTDIRSNKIMVTHDFEPMLGDFGLGRPQHEVHDAIDTHGYLAPEYIQSALASTKTDVYAFGVVLLELLTGRNVVDTTLPIGQQTLVAWARPLLVEQRCKELIDNRLQLPKVCYELYNMNPCSYPLSSNNPSQRPTMNKVVHILEGDESKEIEEDNSPATTTNDSYNNVSEPKSFSSASSGKFTEFNNIKNPHVEESTSLIGKRKTRQQQNNSVMKDMLT